ncbi:MAG TPA: ABC transporter substrate-binding protein [Actinomycetota bacterium]|nr:ABC transporter substrate-binding protein [Actinomycetota bacterium]
MTSKTRHGRVLWSLLLLFSLGATACGGPTEQAPRETGARQGPKIVVGSANFSESEILGEIYAQALEHEGYEVERRFQIGSREIYAPALERGDISLMPEYVEAIYRHVTGEDGPGEPDQIVSRLNEALEPKGLRALEPAEAENRDGQAVTAQTAQRLNLRNVSDLGPHAGEMIFSGPPECRERPACLQGLRDVYGLEFKEFKGLDGQARYAAVSEGTVDIIQVFTTDGAIAARELVVLNDDKGISGDQRIVPVVRADLVEAHGDDLVELLDSISAALATEDLVEMNRQVDVDRADPAEAARDWLEENDFVA